jgi:hypothetical protein
LSRRDSSSGWRVAHVRIWDKSGVRLLEDPNMGGLPTWRIDRRPRVLIIATTRPELVYNRLTASRKIVWSSSHSLRAFPRPSDGSCSRNCDSSGRFYCKVTPTLFYQPQAFSKLVVPDSTTISIRRSVGAHPVPGLPHGAPFTDWHGSGSDRLHLQ